MVQPNWGLAGGGNALGMFQLGTQIGGGIRQQREERDYKNALSAYATNPGQESLAGVIAVDPRTGIQLQQQQAQMAARQQEAEQQQATQRRNDLPLIDKLLGSITDEASYARAQQAAQRYGIDMSDAPQTYDPAWVQETRAFAQAVQTPQGQEALSTSGKLATDAGLHPGTPEYIQFVREHAQATLARPYTGSQGETRLYQPQLGGMQQAPAQAGPQPGAVEDGYRFKGGNPSDPASWEPVAGGGGGNVTSGFLSGV